MTADLKDEVKVLVADTAARVLARDLSFEERTRYLDRAVFRLAEIECPVCKLLPN
jgi:hypothetical protein